MKLIIFGVGKAGKKILSYPLRKNCEIVAVVDNNKEAWGTEVEGHKVLPPNSISNLSYDIILIAVMKYYYEVEEQLMSMGVSRDKIQPAVGWERIKYLSDELDEYFHVEKQNVPFEKKPVTGNLPSGEETRKAHNRRVREGFFDKYCNGEGLDICCASDPVTPGCSGWDMINGDAQYLHGVEDEIFDFVYSSHGLEHMRDVRIALKNWFRVVRRGGYLILYIPHRDLYEKRKTLPSKWNLDHKHMFLIGEAEAPDTLDIVEEIRGSLEGYDILYIKKCDEGHTIDDPDVHSDGEYAIEIVIKKKK